jgi:hypothetical protein
MPGPTVDRDRRRQGEKAPMVGLAPSVTEAARRALGRPWNRGSAGSAALGAIFAKSARR